MNTFDDRKKGFENKFAHDEELRFKATARRNKLLGLWAAEKLGLSGDAAESYAKEVVASDFEEAGDDDVVRKVLGISRPRKVDQSEHRVRPHHGRADGRGRRASPGQGLSWDVGASFALRKRLACCKALASK